jgi:hypothetical protein
MKVLQSQVLIIAFSPEKNDWMPNERGGRRPER